MCMLREAKGSMRVRREREDRGRGRVGEANAEWRVRNAESEPLMNANRRRTIRLEVSQGKSGRRGDMERGRAGE